jgi:uncharacterized protein YdaT
MPKVKQKTKHLSEEEILDFLDSDDDALPPVQVESNSVPDPPYTQEEEIIIEHVVRTYRSFLLLL